MYSYSQWLLNMDSYIQWLLNMDSYIQWLRNTDSYSQRLLNTDSYNQRLLNTDSYNQRLLNTYSYNQRLLNTDSWRTHPNYPNLSKSGISFIKENKNEKNEFSDCLCFSYFWLNSVFCIKNLECKKVSLISLQDSLTAFMCSLLTLSQNSTHPFFFYKLFSNIPEWCS